MLAFLQFECWDLMQTWSCWQQNDLLKMRHVMQLSVDKKQKIYDKALGAIKDWLERFDTIIIRPGLGRDEMVHYVVKEVSGFGLLA